MNEFKIGMSNEVTATVDDKMTALAVGSGTLEVLATPVVGALMEKAACELLQPYLDEGITTVGTMITINHVSASSVGATVTAKAVLTGISGRKYTFDLFASDNSGVIATGEHERFSVKSDKFMSKVAAKLQD